MARNSRLQPLADLVTGQLMETEDSSLRDRPDLKLNDARLEALDLWSKDPWSFLTGVDPETHKPIINTQDQKDRKHPVKPFPTGLEYLHYLVELLESERYIQIEKASQMIVTTTIALWSAWRCCFNEAHKVLLSKHKEAEAEVILAEKIKTPWQAMPEWMQIELPCRVKPAHKAIFPKRQSYILGLPENAAAADARGTTYNIGLIDEAEWQDELQAILTAMLPRAGQIVFWSTPAPGGEGARIFRSYLANDPIRFSPALVELRKKFCDLKGITTRRNEDKDFTICRIEHTADPAKRTKEWEKQARRAYPSDADFRREMKIDRKSNAGRPYHPAFSEQPELYKKRAPGLITAPIVRSWDFGGRNPACLWSQWSKKSRRFWVLRELLGKDIDTYAFADLVLYLSGQLSYESMVAHTTPGGGNRCYELLEDLKYDRAYPAPPWFVGNHTFLDYAGHEALRPGPGLSKAGDPKIAAEILATRDIHVMAHYVFEKSRKQVIDALAKVRSDGLPGILLDPACPILHRGLTGEIVYAKGTPSNPDPNVPEKSSVHSHLYEALGYAVVNTVALEQAEYMLQPSEGGMPPMDEDDSEYISSYLAGGEL